MEGHSDVKHQMESIRYIFQQALHISTDQDNQVIQDHLEKVDPEFKAVAYEGLAMGFAVKDFEEGTLKRWRQLLHESNDEFKPHVYIGLGWAIAKQKTPSLIFIQDMSPLAYARVIDGIGYFEGTFRYMQSVVKQRRLSILGKNEFNAYDQGLGRSIWYTAEGNIEKVKAAIKPFASERQPHLWRGIGVAATFVGNNEQVYQALREAAFDHTVHLATGAAIVARARIISKTNIQSADRACRIWCAMSATDAQRIVSKAEAEDKSKDDAYNLWLDNMKSELSEAILNLPKVL